MPFYPLRNWTNHRINDTGAITAKMVCGSPFLNRKTFNRIPDFSFLPVSFSGLRLQNYHLHFGLAFFMKSPLRSQN